MPFKVGRVHTIIPAGVGGNPATLRCQFQVQIVPIGISCFDYPDFPGPIPFFDLFFTSNCGLNRFMLFKPDQPVDIVLFGKSIDKFILVLPYALDQITRYTYI